MGLTGTKVYLDEANSPRLPRLRTQVPFWALFSSVWGTEKVRVLGIGPRWEYLQAPQPTLF